MAVNLPKQIDEFFTAARHSFSYNLRRNIYIWFGIFWGLPIPLATILMQVHFLEASGADNPFLAAICSPLQWFFLAHPLLFGIIFGIMGTIRNNQDT
jgi:hypothetical protein